MSGQEYVDQPSEVASKVLRRAKVSKMTRALQNRLALANVKIKHGWENLSIDTIEPQIEQQLKRKRPALHHDTISVSDTCSTISTDRYHPFGGYPLSPIAAPRFTDGPGSSGGGHSRKRMRGPDVAKHPASSTHTRNKVRSSNGFQTSWKSEYKLPESSPAYHSRHVRFPSSHVSHLSFISEGSTVPDEPPSPLLSEDDDDDLPVNSFHVGGSNVRSSPPCTPPSGVARSARLRNSRAVDISWSQTPKTGAEDTGFLHFLADSPSPAKPRTPARAAAPSTPPSKATPLPSSMMSTPGGGGGAASLGFGPNTPSNNFNFADFVNVTPSPAQGSWNRTPRAAAKTPVTAREARRKLNFDTLLPPPPPTSNSGLAVTSAGRDAGLGMQLGGELAR
ncbi:hypothetical protein LTR66_007261 [Elasticomyces elasticus]|nr:hypothetical protein LTR66_007261 [Elasticomyces elasticus]